MAENSKTVRITKRVVDAIKADGSDFYIFDTDLTGFGIRVRPTGGMTYIARYRAGSGRGAPVRRVTIAKVGKVTPEQARERARDILADVVKGQDPAKAKAETKKALTFAQLAAAFLVHVQAKKKPNTYSQYAHMLNAYAIPELGTRKAAAVDAADVASLHLKLEGKKTTANRVRDVISSMYGWGVKYKHLPAKFENPAFGIEKYGEAKRERFLSRDEMQRLGAAIREAETDGIPWEPDPNKKTKHAPKANNRRVKIDPSVAAALRLFILTGARLREILHLTWSMVDLERGLLLLPDSKTGEKTIILNAPAQLILSELPRVSRFVIPGKGRKTKDGTFVDTARSDLKRPWGAVRKRAGLLSDNDNPRLRVRIHDLRHTHASVGVGSNLGLPIVGKLLGHTQARTTERYAHLEADPLKRASDAIGAAIASAMGEAMPEAGESAEIIPLKRKEG